MVVVTGDKPHGVAQGELLDFFQVVLLVEDVFSFFLLGLFQGFLLLVHSGRGQMGCCGQGTAECSEEGEGGDREGAVEHCR